MRYCIRFVILVVTLLVCFPGYGQRKPKIKGNRSVISVNNPLNAFSHVSVTDGLEVRLEPGEEEMVQIEADDNLIDILRFEQDGDTLKISSFYNITGSKQLDLTLTYRELESIRLENGTAIAEEMIKGSQLRLEFLEGSVADLKISASLVEMEMRENASAELHIATDSLSVNMGDQSKAFIYTTDSAMDFQVSGKATTTLEGTGNSLRVSITDNATLKGEGLEVSAVTAFLNASSQVRINALSELSYEGRDKSKLYVYGQPNIKIIGFFDAAQLLKVPQ